MPELTERLAIYLEVFERLSRARQMGFAGPQAIAVGEMLAMWHVLRLGDALEFVRLIQGLDAVFMARVAELRPAKP